MNILLLYMVKAAVYLLGFCLIYFTLLSSDTMYARNRIFILVSCASSFILPLVSINVSNSTIGAFFGKTLSEVFVTPIDNTSGNNIMNGSATGFYTILLRIYIAGVLFFIFKLILDIIRLYFLIRRQAVNNNKLIKIKGLNTSGFSAMGYIFINQTVSEDEAKEIIKHEMNHLKMFHFWDILFLEIVKIFQWFNPAIHMLNRSLRAIHEYQADEGYLRSGIPVVKYQNLLLNHVLKTKIFLASNSFSNPTLIKKRMIMMTKKRSGRVANLKILMVLPVAMMIMLVFSSCGKSSSQAANTSEIAPPPPPPPPEPVYDNVDIMPVFPGGEKALIDFMSKNIIYPDEAKKNNVQGRIIARFCVSDKGKIDRVQIVNGVTKELDDEAVRVIKMFPEWTPGQKDGKPVNVWFNLPITFKLQ